MIFARGLGRQFGSLVAVDDLNLAVSEGMLLALLGPNGAGKTTTVRLLSGLLAPTHGSATVAGCDVASNPSGVRARIGLVTDVPGLYEQMSPLTYLDFFGRLYGLDPTLRGRRIADLLDVFGLTERRFERMATFSRGTQQKLALARALLHEPPVLFLDEPTAGLDPLAARTVREMILRLKHGRRSIVLCTHDLDEAERLADQVAIMQGGRILALDAPTALRTMASPDTLVRITLAAPLATAPDRVVEFRTAAPDVTNPRVIGDLVRDGAQIVSVTCSTLTLEDVYATAVSGDTSRLRLAGSNGARDTATDSRPSPANPLPGETVALLRIAWRAAIESLNDRLTRLMNVLLAVVAPIMLLVFVIKPFESATSDLTPNVLPFYLLVIGLMPAVGAVGIAAGQFAGERERGVLTPLLASPASNLAIFGGKVLGSIVPPLMYSAIAEAIYIAGIVAVLGAEHLRRLPPAVAAAMLLLVPAATCLAAIVGALVSSRVRTFNAAQQVAGIVLVPLWAGLFGLAFRLQDWGAAGMIAGVAGILGVDVVLTVVAAATWRREEVLSQR
ncbi:MAG TPA: ATP-binding cassette domain-containing protein [Chloroflexota bacterium]